MSDRESSSISRAGRFPLGLSILALLLAGSILWGLGRLERQWSDLGLGVVGLGCLALVRILAEIIAEAFIQVGADGIAERRSWLRPVMFATYLIVLVALVAWKASH